MSLKNKVETALFILGGIALTASGNKTVDSIINARSTYVPSQEAVAQKQQANQDLNKIQGIMEKVSIQKDFCNVLNQSLTACIGLEATCENMEFQYAGLKEEYKLKEKGYESIKTKADKLTTQHVNHIQAALIYGSLSLIPLCAFVFGGSALCKRKKKKPEVKE